MCKLTLLLLVCQLELMDDVAMDVCNRRNGMDYEVAPTLFLEFHGTEESVQTQAQLVGKFKTCIKITKSIAT